MKDSERIIIEDDGIYRESIVYQGGQCFVKSELILTKNVLVQALKDWEIIKEDWIQNEN